MNIFCKIFGHNWNVDDKYRQPCKRTNCCTTKYMVVNQITNKTGFEIIDFSKIIKRKH